METSEIIAGLKDLIHDRESFITPDNDKFYGEENPFRHDKAVLQAAIDELTRRAEPGNKPLAVEQQNCKTCKYFEKTVDEYPCKCCGQAYTSKYARKPEESGKQHET